jgi:hypothetical protein
MPIYVKSSCAHQRYFTHVKIDSKIVKEAKLIHLDIINSIAVDLQIRAKPKLCE